MIRNTICSECGGEMKAGLVIGNERGTSFPQDAAYWLEGPFERGFLGLKTKGRRIYYMVAYRCERCSFLKFYAGPDHNVEDKE